MNQLWRGHHVQAFVVACSTLVQKGAVNVENKSHRFRHVGCAVGWAMDGFDQRFSSFPLRLLSCPQVISWLFLGERLARELSCDVSITAQQNPPRE